MELTQGQRDAIEAAIQTSQLEGPQVGVVVGWAGTGKTSVIAELPEALGYRPLVLTPTGKAALRAQTLTGLQAMTIHRWLYHSKYDPNNEKSQFMRKTAEELDQYRGKLLVVDEASMVGSALWHDVDAALIDTDAKALLVGDAFQLPPVDDRDGWCALDVKTPRRVLLDEVLRQSADSPILKAATAIRTGSRAEQALGLLPRVMADDVVREIGRAHEQGAAILTHSNKLRRQVCAHVRRSAGLGPGLQDGEPLLVLQNSYTAEMYNGEVVRFDRWLGEGLDAEIKRGGRKIRLESASVNGLEVMLCPESVAGDLDELHPMLVRGACERACKGSLNPRFRLRPYVHATYGYALTTHKSQGNEWDNVLLLIEESVKPNSEQGRRWIYTGITRARTGIKVARLPYGWGSDL